MVTSLWIIAPRLVILAGWLNRDKVSSYYRGT
jgi:hypothetical protein